MKYASGRARVSVGLLYGLNSLLVFITLTINTAKD